MPETVTMTAVSCTVCAATSPTKPTRTGNARLPRGWHRQEDACYCPACWGQRYRLVAVTFPVRGPLNGDRAGMWAGLTDAWTRCRYLANWALTTLYTTDVQRAPGAEGKIPAHPKVSLYDLWNRTHHARAQWTGATQSANCLLHACERKYGRVRREVVWWGSMSLPCHRYPVPYPVHNQAWRAYYHEIAGANGQVTRVPAVSVPFGGQRWELQLRGGPEVSRQLRAFRQLVNGQAIKGELALYRQRSSEGAHRSTGRAKAPGGGNEVRTRLMCKLVAWVPVEGRRRREDQGLRTLEVRTATNCLLLAFHPDTGFAWRLHDHALRGLIATHRCRVQMMADDTKAERRSPRQDRGHLHDRLDLWTTKYRRALKSHLDRAAAMLATYAERCKVDEIAYDDTRDYLGGRRLVPSWLAEASEEERAEGAILLEFPRAMLREAITQRCLLLGISLTHTNASAEDAATEGAPEPGATD